MYDIERLEKSIKDEINKNIKLYNNHNIYLIDIKEICDKQKLDFDDICTTIGNVDYICREYKNTSSLITAS